MLLGSKVPPYVSRLSRHCGVLNISQPYRPPRPDTEIVLLLFIDALSAKNIS
jgi:hypothetical protein